MRIAVEGCCHGELDKIYDTIRERENADGFTVDLLLICGDFQAHRNTDDLHCMASPPRYRHMRDFYKYYKKEKMAPVLTIVIGGNHEASNYMQELPYGGLLAPNIYYLGYAGIVNVGGVRIGGISGIFHEGYYSKGHYERPPYTSDTLRSAYYTRTSEVFKLKQVRQPVDVMMSHEWPTRAFAAGDVQKLMRMKPGFRGQLDNKTVTLGSPAAQEVLTHVKPAYWFSAHHHCSYVADIRHEGAGDMPAMVTKFQALDKCMPGRDYLKIIEIPNSKEPPYKIELDPEWLVILKNTNHLLNITKEVRYMAGVESDRNRPKNWRRQHGESYCATGCSFKAEDEEIKSLLEDFNGDLTQPENFEMTVTPYDGVSDVRNGRPPSCQVNPQTTQLCQKLNLTDPFAAFCGHTSNESN